jgi:hypothetical protein
VCATIDDMLEEQLALVDDARLDAAIDLCEPCGGGVLDRIGLDRLGHGTPLLMPCRTFRGEDFLRSFPHPARKLIHELLMPDLLLPLALDFCLSDRFFVALVRARNPDDS